MLNLVLTFHWYDEIEAGRKPIEYREMSPTWTRLIWNHREKLKDVRFQRAYTKTHLFRKISHVDTGPCPYPGWDGIYYRLHLSSNK